MTQQEYKKIAEVFSFARETAIGSSWRYDGIRETQDRLSTMFARSDPKFEADRFADECNPDSVYRRNKKASHEHIEVTPPNGESDRFLAHLRCGAKCRESLEVAHVTEERARSALWDMSKQRHWTFDEQTKEFFCQGHSA